MALVWWRWPPSRIAMSATDVRAPPPRDDRLVAAEHRVGGAVGITIARAILGRARSRARRLLGAIAAVLGRRAVGIAVAQCGCIGARIGRLDATRAVDRAGAALLVGAAAARSDGGARGRARLAARDQQRRLSPATPRDAALIQRAAVRVVAQKRGAVVARIACRDGDQQQPRPHVANVTRHVRGSP